MNAPNSGPLVWLVIILITCVILVVAQNFLWLVVPILVATILYYLCEPLVKKGIRSGLNRSQSVFVVVTSVSLLLAMLALIFVPRLVETTKSLNDSLGKYTEGVIRLINSTQKTASEYLPFIHPITGHDAIETIKQRLTQWVQDNSTEIILDVLHWVPSLLLVPYFTYFFLLEAPRFKRFLVRTIPNAFFERTLDLFFRVDNQVRRYFSGMLALTALDTLCLGIGLWIVGLNAPFSMAIIAAVLAWIPYLGSIVGCLLVVLVTSADAPVDKPWLAYEAIAVFIIVRLLDDFVFLPLTVGRSLRMHPLLTVVMILIGGAVAGIAGLLLVMPVFGVVMVCGQIIGQLITDERILARYLHSVSLRWKRARADLSDPASP